MPGYFATAWLEALGAALGAGVAELTLGVDDLTLAADGLEQLRGDRGAHVDVVRLQEGQVAVFHEGLRILDQPGVHDDQRHALGDHRVGAVDQRVGGRRGGRRRSPSPRRRSSAAPEAASRR